MFSDVQSKKACSRVDTMLIYLDSTRLFLFFTTSAMTFISLTPRLYAIISFFIAVCSYRSEAASIRNSLKLLRPNQMPNRMRQTWRGFASGRSNDDSEAEVNRPWEVKAKSLRHFKVLENGGSMSKTWRAKFYPDPKFLQGSAQVDVVVKTAGKHGDNNQIEPSHESAKAIHREHSILSKLKNHNFI